MNHFKIRILVESEIVLVYWKGECSFMERNIMQELVTWKDRKTDRMPLVLYGVRQVGKTYILREFGDRYFQNTIYINFERRDIIAEYFQENYLRTDCSG